MSVDAATVKRIGRLARIRTDEEEVASYQQELNAILGWGLARRMYLPGDRRQQ